MMKKHAVYIYSKENLARLGFAVGALILAISPIAWLARSWMDPAYDSSGVWVFFVCVGLFIYSVSSPHKQKNENHSGAISLLFFSALVRLVGQVAAVNVIGALALVVDVYAIAMLAGLQHRKRAVSPLFLAAAFAFSLPIERLVQRAIGWNLQEMSADGACLLLSHLYDRVTCAGVRILIDGQDVLVDLPCSGARSLLLLLFGFCVVAALARPGVKDAVFAGCLTLLAGLVINMGRITILAAGLVQRPFGIDVMAQPWHDVIGLACLALAAMPLLIWAHHVRPSRPTQIPWLVLSSRIGPIASGVFLLACVGIVSAPRHAFDVGHRYDGARLNLPAVINQQVAQDAPLLEKERLYFTQYGGAARKVWYGNHGVLLVRTAAPLRHLHAPDECLRGLGFKVRLIGTRYDPVPSAVYQATAPDGQSFRISVSFVSSEGLVTSNISHAVYLWLQRPKTSWMAVQRISPWDEPETHHLNFEKNIFASLDL